MARFLEIVLDVAASAAPATGNRRRRPAGFAAALADALPQLGEASAADVRIDTLTFDRGSALADAGWRVAVETHGDARQVTVSKRESPTPGVTAYTTIFDAPLDTSGIANALFDAAPSPFRQTLAAAGDIEPAAALICERSRWPWPRDGIDAELVVDANLRVAAADPPVLHELRVRAPWPDDADPAPVVAALFACALDVIEAVPAFVRLEEAALRAAHGGIAGGEVAHAAPVDLGRAQTAQAALIAICHNVTAQWFGNDAGVRDSASTEFVHQMRVSQRRLRTAMRIFSRWADDDWKTRVAPELKWLRGLLGDARDRDVFVESTLPALAAADDDATRWAAVIDEANAERVAARRRVQEALASPRYARIALAWLQWLAALARRDAHDDGIGRSLLRHAKKRVRRYYRRLEDTPKLTSIDDTMRHHVRIDAKYLRYTLEFFAPIVSRKTRTDTARMLSRIQGVLGDGNDAVVGLRYLEAMKVEPYQLGFARGWCEAVKRYTAKEGERLLRDLRSPKIPGDA
ncbi:CHAD domain-containing protein [Paraburkholderia caballeronis]|uniref:CHAD domain-containing protein n=1 Tax=Paraburkholderia caballeronis TaxID=416943 RepID=UPI0010DDE0CF|nr:CHAD domain-containing protein [Paraburkholderia caballeronis]TDV39612.1 CHAD domain-containing protein [Paraburkholderia caballeronis]